MKKDLKWGALVVGLMVGLQTVAMGLLTANYDVPPVGAPIAQELNFTTYCDIAYQGQFIATDSQGDDIAYALDTQPSKGTVTMEGATFVYTPNPGKTGTDRFTYVATDSQGHASAPATVAVEIETVKTDVVYSDTTPVEAAAAIHLAEEGVFIGTQIGQSYYFEPDRTVSRSAFLTMAMEVVGAEVSPVSLSCFCDDDTLSAMTKGYVATAVMNGYVQGVPTSEGVAFQGDAAITFSQASAMLSRVLELEDVDLAVWYPAANADHWASQSVGNLEAIDVVSVGSFGSETLEEPLSRSQAAIMLSAAQTYVDSQTPGLLDWIWKL